MMMKREGGLHKEKPTASLAGEGFLPRVDALVVVQRGQLFEGAPALPALVRLVVVVVQQVLVVGLLESERLVALVAGVGHLP